MYLFNVASFVFGLALAAAAFPHSQVKRASSHVGVSSRADSFFKIYDFLISDLCADSVVVDSATVNRTLHFVFTDPNSNTSALCKSSWTQTNSTNNAPFSYVACVTTTNSTDPEFFQWQFTSYTNPANFQIEFAHEFSDPIHYPPPYNYVEYFSEANNFTLICEDTTSMSGCTLPSGQNPWNATIDVITN